MVFPPAVCAACFLAAMGLLFSACATEPPAPKDYPAFREGRPRSILVMPPVNLSPDIKAAPVFLATSTVPLAESGYYVIPVALSNEAFKQNGVTVAEEAHAIGIDRLREIFGADAALYITVRRFGPRFQLLNSALEAEASARLVDLRSGQELWTGSASITENSSSGSIDSREDLFSMLIGAVVSQIVNTVSDNAFYLARTANHEMLSAGERRGTLLYGHYHPKYGED